MPARRPLLSGPDSALRLADILALQASVGNRAVGRLLASGTSGAAPPARDSVDAAAKSLSSPNPVASAVPDRSVEPVSALQPTLQRYFTHAHGRALSEAAERTLREAGRGNKGFAELVKALSDKKNPVHFDQWFKSNKAGFDEKSQQKMLQIVAGDEMQPKEAKQQELTADPPNTKGNAPSLIPSSVGEKEEKGPSSSSEFEEQLKLYNQEAFQHVLDKHLAATVHQINWKDPKTWDRALKNFNERNTAKKAQASLVKTVNKIVLALKGQARLTDPLEIAAAVRVLFGLAPKQGKEGKATIEADPGTAITKRAGGFRSKQDLVKAELKTWELIENQVIETLGKETNEDIEAESNESEGAVSASEATKIKLEYRYFAPSDKGGEAKEAKAPQKEAKMEEFEVKEKMTTMEGDPSPAKAESKEGGSYYSIRAYLPTSLVWSDNLDFHYYAMERISDEMKGSTVTPQAGALTSKEQQGTTGGKAFSMQGLVESGIFTQKVSFAKGGQIVAIYRFYPTSIAGPKKEKLNRKNTFLTTLYVRPIA